VLLHGHLGHHGVEFGLDLGGGLLGLELLLLALLLHVLVDVHVHGDGALAALTAALLGGGLLGVPLSHVHHHVEHVHVDVAGLGQGEARCDHDEFESHDAIRV